MSSTEDTAQGWAVKASYSSANGIVTNIKYAVDSKYDLQTLFLMIILSGALISIQWGYGLRSLTVFGKDSKT